MKGLASKTKNITISIHLPLSNGSGKIEKIPKAEKAFEYDARISWIPNCIEISNFSLKCVLVVSVVSLQDRID